MQRSPEVEAVVIEMLEAMKTGDADVATAGLSEDLTTAIGTDAEEWWEGYDTSAKAFRAQLEASGGLPIEMTDVRGYEHDGMGWFEARGSVAVENAAAAVVRMTGVLRREPDAWRVVQVHASAGIPNEELGMEGLPI
jgi:ketosteroid isomerase-like protein